MSKLIRNSRNKGIQSLLKSASLIIGVAPVKDKKTAVRLAILDQDESLRDKGSGTTIYYKGEGAFHFEIRSYSYPDFIDCKENILYIRGCDKDDDYLTFVINKRIFNTIFIPGLNEWKRVRFISNSSQINNYIKKCNLSDKLKYKFDKLLVM